MPCPWWYAWYQQAKANNCPIWEVMGSPTPKECPDLCAWYAGIMSASAWAEAEAEAYRYEQMRKEQESDQKRTDIMNGNTGFQRPAPRTRTSSHR